jgi:hypothetical protein
MWVGSGGVADEVHKTGTQNEGGHQIEHLPPASEGERKNPIKQQTTDQDCVSYSGIGYKMNLRFEQEAERSQTPRRSLERMCISFRCYLCGEMYRRGSGCVRGLHGP